VYLKVWQAGSSLNLLPQGIVNSSRPARNPLSVSAPLDLPFHVETGADVILVVLVVPVPVAVAESLIKLRNSARMRREVVPTN